MVGVGKMNNEESVKLMHEIIEEFEDSISYVSDYFKKKYGYEEKIADFRARINELQSGKRRNNELD